MSRISFLTKTKCVSTPLRSRCVRFASTGNTPKAPPGSTYQTKSHFANAATRTPNLEEAIRSDFYGVVKREYHEERLSPEKVEEFNRNGFVKTPTLFSPEETEDLVNYVTEVQRWKETPFKWMQYFEYYGANKTRELCRTENFFSYHAALQNLIVPKLLPMLAQLFGEPAVMYKEKINYKLANGGPFPAHQDAPAYGTFGHKYHITALIAIDDANEQNGCLEFVRDTHKDLVILPHNVAGVIDPKIEETMTWESLPTKRGEAVLFHSFCPHRSGPNKTPKSRRAMFITFNGISGGEYRDKYYEKKREDFPPEIERIPGKDYSEGAKVFNVATPIK